MAKSVVLDREYRKRRIWVQNYLNRKINHSFLKDVTLSFSERQFIAQKLNKTRYSSSIVRFKNYCMLTGHSRSVYKDVKLNRNQFNTMVLAGKIQSWHTASW